MTRSWWLGIATNVETKASLWHFDLAALNSNTVWMPTATPDACAYNNGSTSTIARITATQSFRSRIQLMEKNEKNTFCNTDGNRPMKTKDFASPHEAGRHVPIMWHTASRLWLKMHEPVYQSRPSNQIHYNSDAQEKRRRDKAGTKDTWRS